MDTTTLIQIKNDFVTRRENKEVIDNINTLKSDVKKLDYWQIKATAYATAAAVIINYVFRYFSK